MITRSQCIVSTIVTELISAADARINLLKKTNSLSKEYSSSNILKVMNELKDQILLNPANGQRIKTPTDLKSLRLDSHMSVFNVQQRPRIKRGRSITKFNRRLSTRGSFSITTEKKDIHSPYKRLNKLDRAVEAKVEEEEEIDAADTALYDEYLKKEEKLLLQKQKQSKVVAKNPPSSKIGQKFSYGYEGEFLKVKSEPKNRLIVPEKSLASQVSKKIEKTKVEGKRKKVDPVVVETVKVVERSKKKKVERKRKNTMVREQVPIPEVVKVEFSNINSLTDKFQCEPGVAFSFNSESIKSKSKHYQKEQLQRLNGFDRRYSRKQYEVMKRKYQSVGERRTEFSTVEKSRDEDNESSKKYLSSRSPQNSSNLTHAKRHPTQVITVFDQDLQQELISSCKGSTQEAENSHRQSIHTLNSEPIQAIPLSKKDRFNLKYISNSNNNSTGHKMVSLILPKIEKIKNPYLKNRQKLEGKAALLQALKIRFEESLRQKAGQ